MSDKARLDARATLQDGHITLQIERAVPDDLPEEAHMGTLLVIAGHPADVGTHLVVEDSVVIGRETSGMRLHDARTSRRHAEVVKDDTGHLLRDLGSTNGTRLNGTVVAGDTPLQDGDKIRIGATLVKFARVDQAEADSLRRVTRLARTDPLTGLHAKHQFDALLAETVRTLDPSGRLAVLMMDMDGLKSINDAHGHQVGAATIAQVGTLLGAMIRGRGEASRFGGDEFVVMLPHTVEEEAVALAEAIRAQVEATPFRRGDIDVHATVSIGVAAWSPDDLDPEVLVERADQALYRAKAAGRNCVRSALGPP